MSTPPVKGPGDKRVGTNTAVNSANLPPTLILHGDADTLVPIQQSQTFAAKAETVGAQVQLVVRAGEGHAIWKGFDKDLGFMADWFDRHLRGLPPK